MPRLPSWHRSAMDASRHFNHATTRNIRSFHFPRRCAILSTWFISVMILQKFAQSLADTSALQPRYRRMTSAVGLVAVLVGCVFMVAFIYYSRKAFGLPMGAAPLEGIRLK